MEKNTPNNQTQADQLRAENMAYAAQSVVFNLAGNLYEPVIQSWVQKRYAMEQGTPKQAGSWFQNVAGEFFGDVGGSTGLFLASSLVPDATQGFINSVGRMVHPVFHTVGHAVFKDQFNEPDFQAKVDKWTTFQERNFARSLIVMAGNISANIAAQKYAIRNPSPAHIIFKGKLASTGVTSALNMGLRLFAPQKMKDFDAKLGRKYFTTDDEPHEHVKPALPTDLTNFPTAHAPSFTAQTLQPASSYAERVQQADPNSLSPAEFSR